MPITCLRNLKVGQTMPLIPIPQRGTCGSGPCLQAPVTFRNGLIRRRRTTMTSFTFFPPFFPIFLPLERKPDPDEYKEIADAIRWAAMTPAERKAEREAERKALEADRKQASRITKRQHYCS